MLAVPIKNSMPALLEQKTLTVHIICKILVLIFSDMIRFKIGKHADIKHKSGYAVKHQRLGRDFHHNSIESRIYHFCKKLLYPIRFRCRICRRNTLRTNNRFDRADQSGFDPRRL